MAKVLADLRNGVAGLRPCGRSGLVTAIWEIDSPTP